MPTRVICHPAPGHNSRNRADRTWPAGATVVPDGELTKAEIAALRADPRFTVVDLPDDALKAPGVRGPAEIEGKPVEEAPAEEPAPRAVDPALADPAAPSEPMAAPVVPQSAPDAVAPVQTLIAHRAEGRGPEQPTREQATPPQGHPQTHGRRR